MSHGSVRALELSAALPSLPESLSVFCFVRNLLTALFLSLAARSSLCCRETDTRVADGGGGGGGGGRDVGRS